MVRPRILYGPPNYLVTKITTEDRRMFGFWTLILAIIGSSLCYFLDASDSVWFLWLTVLSVLALVPNFSSETPVEVEDTEGK